MLEYCKARYMRLANKIRGCARPFCAFGAVSAAQPIQCLQSKETPAAAILAKLKAEHSAVRGCMDEMERITDQASGDRGEYVRARFQLSQASFSLRLCVEAAHQIGDVFEPEVSEHLRRTGAGSFVRSRAVGNQARATRNLRDVIFDGICRNADGSRQLNLIPGPCLVPSYPLTPDPGS